MDTIKSFERFSDPWESKYGTMYPFAVVLEGSPDTVFANGTSESPWWATVGSIVETVDKGQTKTGKRKVSFTKPEGVEQPPRAAPHLKVKKSARDEIISLAMIFKIAAERGGDATASLILARELWDSFQEFQESPTSDTSPSLEEGAF
tara:strand:+ start:2139 stop:2582 length:444 start_codon:yes stop_codon:yes gene_type:complete